jgi:hypothetical protein
VSRSSSVLSLILPSLTSPSRHISNSSKFPRLVVAIQSSLHYYNSNLQWGIGRNNFRLRLEKFAAALCSLLVSASIEFRFRKWHRFCRALNFHVSSIGRHHDIHVSSDRDVFVVVEIEQEDVPSLMPTLMADTYCVMGFAVGGIRPASFIFAMARVNATKPPVMAAVRVPPSACKDVAVDRDGFFTQQF